MGRFLGARCRPTCQHEALLQHAAHGQYLMCSAMQQLNICSSMCQHSLHWTMPSSISSCSTLLMGGVELLSYCRRWMDG